MVRILHLPGHSFDNGKAALAETIGVILTVPLQAAIATAMLSAKSSLGK